MRLCSRCRLLRLPAVRGIPTGHLLVLDGDPVAGAGAELLAPGLVTLSDWWPEDGAVPPGVNGHIGIGRRSP
jgi:hypothetical protein